MAGRRGVLPGPLRDPQCPLLLPAGKIRKSDSKISGRPKQMTTAKNNLLKKLETAVLGGGCFWCTETVFNHTKGVWSVMPGYAGGTKTDPAYEEVCGEKTGHAEVVKIEYDPQMITYR